MIGETSRSLEVPAPGGVLFVDGWSEHIGLAGLLRTVRPRVLRPAPSPSQIGLLMHPKADVPAALNNLRGSFNGSDLVVEDVSRILEEMPYPAARYVCARLQFYRAGCKTGTHVDIVRGIVTSVSYGDVAEVDVAKDPDQVPPPPAFSSYPDYPERTELRGRETHTLHPGDVFVLNNDCHPLQQVIHGVYLAEPVPSEPAPIGLRVALLVEQSMHMAQTDIA